MHVEIDKCVLDAISLLAKTTEIYKGQKVFQQGLSVGRSPIRRTEMTLIERKQRLVEAIQQLDGCLAGDDGEYSIRMRSLLFRGGALIGHLERLDAES